MTILMNFFVVSNFVGTIVMPCCLAVKKESSCFFEMSNFLAEVSTVRAFV